MYRQREAQGAADLAAIAALVRELPEHHHHIDHPYRLCSPSAVAPGHVALWQDAGGALVAAAIIQRQFWVADWYIRPQHAVPELWALIYSWCAEHLRAVGDAQGAPQYFIFDAKADDRSLQDFLAAQGCARADWHYWHMARDLRAPIEPVRVAEGFTLRSLRPDEAGAYAELHRTAFGTANMTEAWRERTLARPEYRNDLDLVIEAPDGRLAAFCVLWCDGDAAGQVEPLGTHPEFRGLGLGRALLYEGMRRLRDQGTTTIYVEVDATNAAGRALYEAVGFKRQTTVYKYARTFGGAKDA